MTPEQRLAARRNSAIEKQNFRDMQEDQEKIKLLLLGAGESGKSTIFKQMKKMYGAGFDMQRPFYKGIIHSNVIESIRKLLAEVETPCGATDAASMVQGTDTGELSTELAQAIRQCWNDASVQQAYEDRANFQLTDSAKFFLDIVEDLAAEDYLPSDEHILRSRVRTTGITEETFIIDHAQFVICDVGGQRNERKKWIHCFSDVTAILFITAISSFDMSLLEDESTNRLDESLNLFEEITHSPYFQNTSFLLFLNKRDLLEEKLKTTAFSREGYEGDPNSFPQVCAFIQSLFEKRAPETTRVYSHVTCATDTNNVRVVFDACKDPILQENLQASGLL